jgi:PhoPQ-activated pathogenicity-related protein
MDEFFNFDLGLKIEQRPSVDIIDPLIIDLVRVFNTNKGDYKKYYNDWSKGVVGRYYEEDIDTFKYTF